MPEAAVRLAESDYAPIVADLPRLDLGYPMPATPTSLRRVFVDHGLALRGELQGCEHLAIAGHVEADVAARIIEILEQGSFAGTATVDEARIAGRYEGALVVEDTLVVGPSARIRGAVQCGRLQLEEGGKIDGELRVLAAEVENAAGGERETTFETLLLEAAPGTEADLDEDRAPVHAAPDEARMAEGMLVSAVTVEDRASLAAAEATFRAALEANLCDVAALSGLGHLARQRGDLTGALNYFELVMAADAGNVSVRCVSINILRDLSRHAEAEAMAKAVLAIRPPLLTLPAPSTHAAKAPVPADTPAQDAEPSGFDEAEAMFNAVLKRHPENLGALAGLGHLARRRGDRTAMRKYYGAALGLEPMNLILRVEVARAFKEVGDIDEGLQILESVLDEQVGATREPVAAGRWRS